MNRSEKKNSLGFDQIAITEQGVTRKVLRFRCVECPQILDMTPGSLTPEAAANKAKHLGWAAHGYRRTDTYCPDCRGPRKAANDPDSELRKVKLMAVTPMVKPSEPQRLPTNDQRAKIRQKLDMHFDDSNGMYIDGMTDQKIAELCDVPRIFVEQVREAAYGSLRYDPAVAALMNELATTKQHITNVQGTLAKMSDEIERLQSRVQKLTEK